MKKTYTPMEMKIDKISVNQAVAACTSYHSSGYTYEEGGIILGIGKRKYSIDTWTPPVNRVMIVKINWTATGRSGKIDVTFTDKNGNNIIDDNDGEVAVNDSNFSSADFKTLLSGQTEGALIIAS